MFIFKKQMEHEGGIKKTYIQCMKSKRYSFEQKMDLKRRGARYKTVTRNLDRKIDRCYPRGKAWLRICDLHALDWLQSK